MVQRSPALPRWLRSLFCPSLQASSGSTCSCQRIGASREASLRLADDDSRGAQLPRDPADRNPRRFQLGRCLFRRVGDRDRMRPEGDCGGSRTKIRRSSPADLEPGASGHGLYRDRRCLLRRSPRPCRLSRFLRRWRRAGERPLVEGPRQRALRRKSHAPRQGVRLVLCQPWLGRSFKAPGFGFA
jgi:hypothetical protein